VKLAVFRLRLMDKANLFPGEKNQLFARIGSIFFILPDKGRAFGFLIVFC